METKNKDIIDKIADIFMFREGTELDNETNSPSVTTGSIVWGILLRSAIIISLSIVIIGYTDAYNLWWITLFAVWFLAAYPGYRQYQKFNKRIEDLKETTLCGSCRHFESTGQLCTLYDEHISRNHVPCEGMNWEPKS